MLRVQTSFQDTPGGGFYFVLYYRNKPLAEQLDELGLDNGDSVMLCEDDCDYEAEAVFLFDYKHPMMSEKALWAKAKPKP